MQPIVQNLEKIIANYSRRLEAMPPELYTAKPRPEKWSRQEILGHLVDSAQNNIRRFVVSQYEDGPTIPYAQDAWVACADYQHYPLKDLLALWQLLNRHIVILLRTMSPAAAQRICTMGGLPQTLEWVAADYCNHLLHHLHQILDLDPIAYP
jgi:hypothetical protein